ncbi:adhesion G-protein coupled receptor F2 isoform X2 [Heterocephalus glaber]|uniref:Adhesion G-protein coupled receptor F2 isoform X2 n=1 Tax=Heterocephalus glaber TaxID=10181 RepID=A0AAX6PAE6_HETGA|nr:adhesion G-protein coupled receptor F2 isoform X2 [Heterocephalus glaber]
MICALLMCYLVFLVPTESCGKLCQAASNSKEKESSRPWGVCDGICVASSHCSQPCPPGTEGSMGFACRKQRWHKVTDTCCTLNAFNIFEEDSQSGNPFGGGGKVDEYARKSETIAGKLMQKCPADLSCAIRNIEQSPRLPGNIAFIVQLLHNISTALMADVEEAQMHSYSSMANHVLNSSSISNWTFIPERNSSCVLLHSVNSFARKLLINKSPINISNTFIHTMGSIIAADDEGKNFTFSMRVNDTSRAVTGKVLMGREELQTAPSIFQIISIAFPTLGAILEASLLENVTVNGLVLSVILPPKFKRISLLFEKISKSEERKTECVGWDHLESRWDSQACQMVEESSQHAVCQCWPSKLFTSFSILMSRHTPVSPVLTFITYIGLGISICSLLICLSIEALVWGQVTKTEISYLRHLCIANVAATLLMADVWFIVASFLSGPVTHHKGCVAATFFIHFFYLSVFFWMLAKALLILYGVLIVFHTLPKSILVASLFSVGYGCPLIIAIITVGVTEPGKGYLRPEACWLNWDMTRALLAFVVPALAIVVVNLVTIMLVIIKTQRVATGSSMFQEVRAVLRISKNIAILTPLLGLTWGFGIATVIDNSSLVFHIIFSLLNAFQGFFILVFGTILDPKIREALKGRVTSAKRISRVSENLSSDFSRHPTKRPS